MISREQLPKLPLMNLQSPTRSIVLHHEACKNTTRRNIILMNCGLIMEIPMLTHISSISTSRARMRERRSLTSTGFAQEPVPNSRLHKGDKQHKAKPKSNHNYFCTQGGTLTFSSSGVVEEERGGASRPDLVQNGATREGCE
jgi:hypothetical protein